MRVYSRDEIKEMINDQIADYQGLGYTKRIFLKDWAEANCLYYHGLVRFLKGSEINLHTYSKIMEAINPNKFKELRHYLGNRIFYSDLKDIYQFIDEIQTITP